MLHAFARPWCAVFVPALLLFLFAPPVHATDVLDQSQPTSTGTSFGCGLGEGESIGQTFVARMSPVSVIWMLLRSGTGMPAGGGVPTTIRLRAGGPDGALLAEGTGPITSAGPSDIQWTGIGFTTPACVTPGDTCYIEWDKPSDAIAMWMAARGDPYPSGSMFGCGHHRSLSYDAAFMTFARDAADLTPPALAVTATPATLWPPTGRLVEVHVALAAHDDGCGPLAVRLVSATSNRDDDGHGHDHGHGHGHAGAADIAGADLGTPDTLVLLRAVAGRHGEPTTYALAYEAVDAAGNTTRDTATVRVQGRGRGDWDGQHLFALEISPAGTDAGGAYRIALPEAGETVIECLDVAGRVVSARSLGALAAGEHEVVAPWAQRPAAGVYWVRVRQAGAASATRVVIVH